MASYTVVGEVWSMLEASLMAQARKLTEDLASYQKTDFKPLWAKVKPQIKVNLLDIDLPDPPTTYCSHPLSMSEGAIKLRCRAPCMLGYNACPAHINTPLTQQGTQGTQSTQSTRYEKVDRVYDFYGRTYFVDSHGIARDRNGRPKGVVKEEVFYEFQPVVQGQAGAEAQAVAGGSIETEG
jgi:hypothetical protein